MLAATTQMECVRIWLLQEAMCSQELSTRLNATQAILHHRSPCKFRIRFATIHVLAIRMTLVEATPELV